MLPKTLSDAFDQHDWIGESEEECRSFQDEALCDFLLAGMF